MRPLVPLSLLLLPFLGGCDDGAPDKGGRNPNGPGDTALGDDTESEGEDPPSPTALADAAWEGLPVAVFGVPDLDDDDEDGAPDWAQGEDAPEGDRAILTLPADIAADQADGERLVLTVINAESGVHVWVDGALIAPGNGQVADGVEVDLEDGGIPIAFSFDAPLDRAEALLSLIGTDGAARREHALTALAAPLLLNHHLQEALTVYSMTVDAWGSNNDDYIDGYTKALGDAFFAFDGDRYTEYGSPDVWLQDELEFATLTSPDAAIDVVIDSIRDRGLDPLPEREFESPDVAVVVYGKGIATSQDSFGNLEVTPPTETWPFGRIYWGEDGRLKPTSTLTDTLKAQRVQSPFTLDIGFLCVGHVDEYTSFIPDPSAPRGFRFLINDVPSAYAVLEAMDPATILPRYRNDKGYKNVQAILDDAALKALNEDIQADYLTPTLEKVTEMLELTPEEIILIPGLFEEAFRCGGYTAAFMPGSINLIVGNVAGEVPQIVMADPFLRTDEADPASDALIQAIDAALPDTVESVYLDDWEIYHLGLGEVHCGSNVIRTAPTPWWESARALELIGL